MGQAVALTTPPVVLRAVRIWAYVPLQGYQGPEVLLLEMAAAQIAKPEPEPEPAPRPEPRQASAPAPPAARPPPAGVGRNNTPPARTGRNNTPPAAAGPEGVRPAAERPPAPAAGSVADRFRQTLRALRTTQGRRFNIGALLKDCDIDQVAFNHDGDRLSLPFRNKSNLDRMLSELEYPEIRAGIIAAIAEYFGERYDFDCVILRRPGAPTGRPPAAGGGSGRVEDHPLVKAALGIGGRILPNDAE